MGLAETSAFMLKQAAYFQMERRKNVSQIPACMSDSTQKEHWTG